MVRLKYLPGSANGRPAEFGSANRGSSPCPGENPIALAIWFFRVVPEPRMIDERESIDNYFQNKP